MYKHMTLGIGRNHLIAFDNYLKSIGFKDYRLFALEYDPYDASIVPLLQMEYNELDNIELLMIIKLKYNNISYAYFDNLIQSTLDNEAH
jgi:hypothetical protein